MQTGAHRRRRRRARAGALAAGAVAPAAPACSTCYDLRHWSERTIIALVMQSLDNSITTFRKAQAARAGGVLTSRQGHGEPNPNRIPGPTRRPAGGRDHGGSAGGTIGEPFGMPLTAHFIGGCPIGDSPETGVIDPYQRVYGHPGLTSSTARRSPPTSASTRR